MILEGAEGRLKSKAKHGAFLWRRYCVKREQRALSLQQRKEPSRGSCSESHLYHGGGTWRAQPQASVSFSLCGLCPLRPLLPVSLRLAPPQSPQAGVVLRDRAEPATFIKMLTKYLQTTLWYIISRQSSPVPGIALKAVTCQGQRKDFSHPPSDYPWPLTLLRVRSIAVRLSTASWVSDQDIW